MKPEAFIFDIGNVLLRFDYSRAYVALEAAGGKLPDLDALGQLARCYERGELGRPDFLARLAGICGHRGAPEELAHLWNDIFEPNQPMWDLIDKIHGTCPLYLLSNTNCLQHEYIGKRYDIFARFADGVFSYRARMMKPERQIFELAIRRFGVNPSATIYLDDLTANVEAARGAGLRAFRYDLDAHADLLATLRAEGVQCV